LPIGQVEVLDHINDEEGACHQDGRMHQSGKQDEAEEIGWCAPPEKLPKAGRVVAQMMRRQIVDRRKGPGGCGAAQSGRREDGGKSEPHMMPLRKEAQQRTRDRERQKADDRHGPRSPREVGAPLVRVQQIGDEAGPGRRREVGTGKIDRHSTQEEPGARLRPEERQQENRNPGERLPHDAPQDLRLPIRKPAGDFDRQKLRPGSHELRDRRQHTEMKRGGVEQQREGGEILLAAALRNRLEQPVADAIAPACFEGRRRRDLRTFSRVTR
jgi:hypothetical protein